jgi:hypothetical protein
MAARPRAGGPLRSKLGWPERRWHTAGTPARASNSGARSPFRARARRQPTSISRPCATLLRRLAHRRGRPGGGRQMVGLPRRSAWSTAPARQDQRRHRAIDPPVLPVVEQLDVTLGGAGRRLAPRRPAGGGAGEWSDGPRLPRTAASEVAVGLRLGARIHGRRHHRGRDRLARYQTHHDRDLPAAARRTSS